MLTLFSVDRRRPHAVLAAALLAALELAAACTPPPPASTPALSPAAHASDTPAVTAAGLMIGVQVSPAVAAQACDLLRRDEAAIAPLWLRWDAVDTGGGAYDWTTLDQQVETLAACGLEAALHVQARRGSDVSVMPADPDEYARFLTALATHLKGRVRRYSIENEAMVPIIWADSAENYFRLLDLAYAAIKAADADAIVLDSGVSSTVLGILRAHDLYLAGQPAEALALVQEAIAESAGEQGIRAPAAEANLEAFFQDPQVTPLLAWMPLLVQHQGSYDAMQIHYYGPWQRLPDLVPWIRAQGITRPLEAWELGRRYRDRAALDETVLAQEVAKILVTTAGEGVRVGVFVYFADSLQTALPGLVTRDGPRPANTAFRVVAHALNGRAVQGRQALGPGVCAYRFTGQPGDLYVLWTDGDRVTVRLPVSATQVAVTDITGASTWVDPRNLLIGPSPVFVTL